jgi:PAS domain S-box-containing protein
MTKRPTTPKSTAFGGASRRWLAMLAAALLLFALVGYLLMINFRSASTIRENLLDQHSQRVRLEASSLGHFLDSAARDLRNLADSREVASFFENRDLGMSMEYGLALSLVPIRERLVGTVESEVPTEVLPFARVALLDAAGSTLADSAGPAASSWTEPLDPSGKHDGVRLSGNGRDLMLTRTHWFKGRHVGYLVAWVRPDAALDQVSGGSTDGAAVRGKGSMLLLLSADNQPFRPVARHFARQLVPDDISPALAAIQPDGRMVEQVGSADEHRVPGGSIAMRVPVPGHPLTLLEVNPASNLMGGLSPRRTAISLTVAAAAVLAVVLAAVFFQTKSLLLRARLDASLAREKEVADKHRALEAEMAERKRLADARALLSQAIDQAAEGIALTGVGGLVEYCNPAFATLTGLPAGDLMGASLASLFGSDEQIANTIGEALRAATVWKSEMAVRRADGSTVDAEVMISPVRGAGGQVMNMVLVARDVTEEQRLRAQLRHAQKLDAVGKLAGGVAHDFNNLLAVIISYADSTLHSLEDGNPLREDIAEIRRAGLRAAELTRQLLAFSRKQVLNPALVDTRAAVESVEKMLRRVIGANVEFVTSSAPDLWPIRFDPGQLEQVIVNLAVNARDAMPDGGKLTISTSNVSLSAVEARNHPDGMPGPYVRMSVSDTGVGMTPSIVAQLFEPFFTTKEVGKGTGLGLSTVYGIVRQSRGFVAVESHPGRGTTFRVYLPAEPAAEAGTGGPSFPTVEASVRPDTPAETVLVVEDEKQLRTLLQKRLEDSGYRVLTATDGVDALEVAAGHRGMIHILVSDIVMPRMGGLQLAGPFLIRHPEALVIFMSGYSDEAVSKAVELGLAAAIIRKPDQISDLPALLRRLLDRSRVSEPARHPA